MSATPCRHDWRVPERPCPACAAETEARAIQRDLAALHCIPAAYKLAMLDVYTLMGTSDRATVTHQAIAAHAYKLADAMLLERESVRDLVPPTDTIKCAAAHVNGTHFCTMPLEHTGDHVAGNSGVRWRR